MLSEDAATTNFIVFGLTRPGLEPTIYRTRDEHANHYPTDVVFLWHYFKSLKHILIYSPEKQISLKYDFRNLLLRQYLVHMHSQRSLKWVIVVSRQMSNFPDISWPEQITFRSDNYDVQLSAGRHVAPLIIGFLSSQSLLFNTAWFVEKQQILIV